MAKYLDKWKTDFPASVGNVTRPTDGIDDTLDFNSDGFPQRISSDPVHYKLENDMASQLFSNDARLKEAIDAIPFKSHIELDFTPKDSLKVAVFNILDAKTIDPIELIKKIRFLDRDKHDEFISIDLKRQAYAYSELDIEGALEFFRQLRKEL